MSSEHTKRLGYRIGTIALIAIASLGSQRSRLAAASRATIIVTTPAELETALSPFNAGARIRVSAGDYDVSQALTVPDGADLLGEGVMSFDESGLPTGFEPSGRTRLRATAALAGDVLTLGDGATVRGLVIEDIVGRPVAGNPVAVVSRAAGDFISARIEECEIINPNPSVVLPGGQGSAGRGLAVITQNPNLGLEPPPHEGASLRVRMTKSILRSPAAGLGVFAINFASRARIQLDLERNVIGGGLNASGGVARPDAVTGASVIIQSNRNLYRSDSPVPTAIGWTLFGGADSPIPGFVSEASTLNSLQIHSTNDRIEGFATGIAASGARRIGALSGPISTNRAELNLHGTLLQTTTTDWRLNGALSLVNVPTGDDNSLHVVVHQATGSGPRTNGYSHSANPPAGSPGTGNRLEIAGNANAFDHTNENFIPPPPAEFFTGHP